MYITQYRSYRLLSVSRAAGSKGIACVAFSEAHGNVHLHLYRIECQDFKTDHVDNAPCTDQLKFFYPGLIDGRREAGPAAPATSAPNKALRTDRDRPHRTTSTPFDSALIELILSI